LADNFFEGWIPACAGTAKKRNGEEAMRPEAQAHADRIKQALDLLRRFL